MHRKPSEPRPPGQRSRVTNGRALFAVGGDERSALARRFRDLVASHVSDLGGADALSENQRSLIRRAVTIEIQLEALEAGLSEGKEIDLDVYGRAAGHLRRVLETLGLKRVPRDITPLHDYIAKKP
jgi:hypothetical protein